jgi:hypothetical protein
MSLHVTTQTLLKRHIALPQEHGSWVFLISPLLIGLFAGGSWSPASGYLILGAFAVFLIRQPVTVLVKIFSGRRAKRDLPAAWFWLGVYAILGILSLIGLVTLGFGYLLILAIPGAPVFAWHLYLVSRRSERRQIGIELVGIGVLALIAPAAYWVGKGAPDPTGWWLFGLIWFQSAASIVYAYLRLDQRVLKNMPVIRERIRMGSRALFYTTFNLAAVAFLSVAGLLPSLLFVPYLLQWAESIYGTLNPAVGVKPTRIGIRQLIVSSLFTVLFIVFWR